MKLKDVLAVKGRRLVTVSAKSSIADAIRTMHAEKIGAVLVPDAEGCPVGIFTERDVVRLHASGDRDFETLAVEARMTCSIVAGRLSMSVDEALGLMTERRFRHLPVVEDGKLLGLVSIG
ncbi:MAG TPA: CBS domain-containing protein, partial [Burkholderiales bacterium]|nr:CBS domain-containing protein [Burkholderiales bacterium]